MVFSDISRKKAFLLHLAVSACVFLVISYLIAFHWFPDFYFFLDGGIRAIATVFFVDVVLGPGLTLLVFKPGKKGLKFDMTVILLLQISALSWGVSSVYSDRSGTTVFYHGKFSCIAHDDTNNINMDVITAGLSGKQRLSFLQRPDTIDGFLEFTMEAFSSGSSAIYFYAGKIVPLDERVVRRLPNYKLNLSELALESEVSARMVESYVEQHEESMEYLHLMPLSCRYGSAIAVFDTRELKITGLIDVKTKLQAEAQDEPLPLKIQIQN